VLLFGFILTAAAWHTSNEFVQRDAQQRFDNRASEIASAIHSRMIEYEQVLQGGVGFFNAAGDVDREKFHTYVSSLKIEKNWPGIQGIGFSVPIYAADKSSHIAKIRGEGFPEYTIKPKGDRSEYSAIIYLEPFDWRNKRAFGYDMWSNGMRREAMTRARDLGVASTSGIITLVQETKDDVQKGFLTYLPLYRMGQPLDTVDQRRQAFLGWVYSPFRMKNLMQGILGSGKTEVDYEIFDGDKLSKDTMLFDSNSKFHQDHPAFSNLTAKTTQLNLQGRTWTLRFMAGPNTKNLAKNNLPTIVLIGGLIVDFLLFFIIYSLVMNQRSTETLAAEITRELEFQKIALDEHAIVSIADIKGNITQCNDKFCEISGYAREELVGQNHRMIKSDEHSPEMYKKMWQTIASGKTWTGEFKNIKKDGSPYWVNATIVPFMDNSGIPFQYVAIRTDITERIQAEESAILSQKQAERANLAKSQFLSSMSHELRTPMNAILGFGQLLENNPTEPLSPKQLEHTQHILKGGDHLLELIDQVLELSKIESGNIVFSIENVEPEEIINESLKMVQTQAEDKGITLTFSAPDIELPMLWTDRGRFRQILLNLLSNAVKYNRVGGSVIVASEYLDKEYLRISVTDTGLGISEHQQAGLFEPFNRLGREAGDVEGTGIGLTITKQITELIGGNIGFESEEGIGSTFWVEIPISEEKPVDIDGTAIAVSASGVAKGGDFAGIILYIEDNPANLQLMEAIIERLPDLTMQSAASAELGIIMARDILPDLILMDINLPGIDGIAALEKLRNDAQTKNIPVIAISAAAMPNEIERGRAAGFEEYITKPIKVPEVLRVISEHIN
jgi:PAS domain S-box-containing protein